MKRGWFNLMKGMLEYSHLGGYELCQASKLGLYRCCDLTLMMKTAISTVVQQVPCVKTMWMMHLDVVCGK